MGFINSPIKLSFKPAFKADASQDQMRAYFYKLYAGNEMSFFIFLVQDRSTYPRILARRKALLLKPIPYIDPIHQNPCDISQKNAIVFQSG